MSDHSIIYDLQYPAWGRWKCEAPPKSFCHAVFSCECEAIWNYRVVDGVPVHDNEPYKDWAESHAGHFENDRCSIQVFHDEADEAVEGTLVVDVDPSWEGEWYSFTATAAQVKKEL